MSLTKVRRTHSPGKKTDDNTTGQTRQNEIQEQDKNMERIEEFYSELRDSDQAITIQIDPKKYHQ